MSRSTESVHVKDAERSAVLAAIVDHMSSLGFVRVADAEQGDSKLRRVAVRQDGAWLSFADEEGFTSASSGLDAWGAHASRALGRPVLTIGTWDGEAAVRAKRWEKGRTQAVLELLAEARWGEDGRPYAPARVLEPWLPAETRAATVRSGFALADPRDGSAVLRTESDDEDDVDTPYVEISVSVAAIGAAVGMTRPAVHPWEPDEGDEALLFRRSDSASAR